MLLTKKILGKILGQILPRRGRTPAYSSPSLLDLRQICNHPAEIQYLANSTPTLMEVDIELGRGLRVFPLTESHPFVLALTQASLASDQFEMLKNILTSYYTKVQPASAAEWLDLPPSIPSPLHDLPPWAVSMPWDVRTPLEWQKAREQFAINENLAFGQPISIGDGWHFWGPVTEKKLAIEAQRLHSLLCSFQSKGYHRHDGHDGDIRAIVLRNGDDWRWQVAGGEHRAAVLAAFDHRKIPVRILQVIQRSDVGFWPGVINGTYSMEAALRTFDMIFSGKLPEMAKSWRQKPDAISSFNQAI